MEINDNEKKVLLEDHDYDGIKELDNNPPPWIMWLFYITVFWSAFYMVIFHVLKVGDLQEAEYDKEIAIAEAQKQELAKTNTFDEQNVAILETTEDLAAGKDLYASKNCAACHGASGEGNAVGPNLTDEYWLNGGTSVEVFKAIKHGIPAKGMTPFKDQLSDIQIQQLTSYTLVTLKGSNPANAKAAQGEIVN